MADKSGILIDVGFKSDSIDSFIQEIQTKLQNTDFGKSFHLDDSLKKELTAINTLLTKINSQKADNGILTAQIQNYKALETRLEKIQSIFDKGVKASNVGDIDRIYELSDALGNLEDKVKQYLKNNEETGDIIGVHKVDNATISFIQNYATAIERLQATVGKFSEKEGIKAEDLLDAQSISETYDAASSQLEGVINKIAEDTRNGLEKAQQEAYAKNAIPLNIQIEDKTAEYETKIDAIIDNLKAYTATRVIPLKVELTTEDDSKAMAKKIGQINKLMPKIDEEGTKEKVEKLLSEISESMIKTFQINFNADAFKEDSNTVKQVLSELQYEVKKIQNIKLTPTVDKEKIEEQLKIYNEAVEDSATTLAAKSGKSIKIGGLSESESFAKNLDLVIEKIKELAAEDSNLNGLIKSFTTLNDLVKKLNDENFSGSTFITSLKAIKKAVSISGKNQIATQIDAIIDKSAPLATAVKSINTAEVAKGFTGLKDVVDNINSFTAAYSSFKNSLNGNINTDKLATNISKVNGELGKLNTSSIDKVKGVNSLAESFNTDKLKEGLETQKATIESFINDVQSYKDEYAAKITEMSEQTDNVKLKLDFGQVEKDLSKISASINNINIPTTPNSVLTVLNELLTKEGAIDKLIALSNSPLGTTIANTKSLAIDDKAIKNNGIERFYSSIDAGKQKLNAAIKNGDLTSINEYYRSVLKISEAYNNIKRTDRSIISQEEFEAARSQLESFVKDTNVMINSIFDNLHPSIKEKFADEIDQVQVYLKATQIKPKKLSGAKDIEDNKAALIEVLNLIERINKEGFLEKSIAEADNRLDILSNKLVRVTSAFEKVSKTPTVANSDNLYTELTQLLELKERIAKDNELQLISDSQMNEANRRIESVISSFKESYKANLTRQFADVPLSGFTDQINAIDTSVDNAMKALNKFDVNTFNAEINKASTGITNLNNAMKATSEYNKESEAFNTALNRLPELQQKAFKGNIGDVNEFVNQLRMVQEQYTRLEEQAKKAGLSEAFKDTKTAVNDIISALSQGYNTVIEKEKKLYADVGQIAKNKNISAQVQNAFSGGISSNLDLVKQAMLAGHNNYASVISDQNVVASGLTYEKVLGKIYNSLIKNSGASKELKGELRGLAKEMESAGANGTSKTMLDSYSKRFQSIDTEMKRTGQTGISFFDRLGKSMTSQTSQLIAMTFSFYRLISVFKQGIQTAVEFDTALAKISYTMDVSQSGIEGMGESMMNLASELKTSLSSIEQIYTIYANMNTSDKEVENLSRYTAVLSNLSGIDASTAADDIQAVVNQFENLNSTDTSHIVDVFDYISRNISVDYQKGIEGMAEGVQAVGNVADQAGLSYEQLSAIIAKTMEQTRNSGSSIANGLKTIMVRLSKASSMDDEVDNSTLSKASAALHEIGVEVYTAEGQFREFDTIMTELAGKWDKLTEAQQANISFQIAATRQTAVLKAILQNWTESMNLATGAVETNGNALENQEKYAETYAAKIQSMKTSFQEMWVNIVESDSFDQLLNMAEGMAEAFSKVASTIGLIPTALASISFIPLLKNIKNVGNGFSKMLDTGSMVGSKSLQLTALKAQKASAVELGLALDGLNARQAALAVSTSELNAAEQQATLAMYAQTQAVMAESTATLGQIFKSEGLSTEQVKYINTALAAAEATDTLTAAKYQEILASEGAQLSAEKQEAIYLKTMALNGGLNAQTGILSKLSTGWTNLAASIGLTGKQLGLLVGGLAVIGGAVWAFEKFTTSEKEYSENLSNAKKEMDDATNSVKNLESELERTQDRLEELKRIKDAGKITLAEDEELTKLEKQNQLLAQQISLEKSKADLEAKEALDEARSNPTFDFKGAIYRPTEGQSIEDMSMLNYAEDNFKTIDGAIDSTLEALTNLDSQYSLLANKLEKDPTNEEIAGKMESLASLRTDINDRLVGLVDNASNSVSIYEQNLDRLNESDKKKLEADKKSLENFYNYMYESTGDETYLSAMSSENRAKAFGEVIRNKIKETYGAEFSETENYVEAVQKVLADKMENGFTVPTDLDLSKIDLKTNPNKSFNVAEGINLGFDVSDVKNTDGLESYVTSLYNEIYHEFEAKGQDTSIANIMVEMLERDTKGLQPQIQDIGKWIFEQLFNPETAQEEAKVSFEDAWANLDTDDAGQKLKESLMDLASQGKLTDESFMSLDGAEKWAKTLNISVEDAIKNINNLTKDTDRLKQLKNDVGKLQGALSEKQDAVLTNKDATKQNEKLNKVEAASASTIADLEGIFGELDAWDDYKKAIGSTTSTVEDCTAATNALLTEYYNLGEKINEVVDATGKVDEATRQYYITQLEELGISNAEEVVNKEILQRKTELLLASKDMNDITEDNVATLYKEAEALNTMGVDADWASQMINKLIIQKKFNEHQKLSAEGDIQYLKELQVYAKQAGVGLDELTAAEAALAQAEYLRQFSGAAGESSKFYKQAQELYEQAMEKINKKVTTDIDITVPSPSDNNGSGSKTSGSTAQKKTKETIDWIARYIDEQQNKINLANAKLENAFGEKKRNKIYNSIIKYEGNIAKAYKVASKKYEGNFSSYVKKNKKYLSDDLINKIKNGKITGDAKKLIQTYGGKRGDIIKEAINRWEKRNESQINYQKALTDKRNAKINKYQDQADRRQASMELNKQYAEAEERGYKAQNDYLDKSQKKNEKRIKKLIKIAKIEHDITEQNKLQEELEQSRIENEKAKFDNLIADYERQRAANERNIQRTQNSMDLQAARGMNISEKYYRSQNSQYNAELKNINNELTKAREKVKSIKQGTDERNEAEQNILDLETEYNTKLQSIYNNNKAIVELYNNYLDTRANVNDRMLNELSFLDGLADYAKHTSKEVKGFFTDAGYAALDVARKGMEISKANMEMYTDNLARLQKARKNADGTFTYLTKEGDSVTFNSELDYVKELQNAYDKVQNYAKSYYDNTVKAVDLMKERYQTELELVKDLVDAKKKELDAEKDLHDYQKTISDKTTNITNLERQLAAYSGNTSEEGRAKLQSLQKQLSDAQKDLEETEYDRYISDQKNMLDDLYQKYNDEVTKRLDQFNKLLEEALGENGAITKGNAFLDQIAKGIGYDSEYNVLKSLNSLKTEITALGQKAYKDSGMDDGKGGSSKTNNTSTKEDLSPRQSFVIEQPQKQKNNNKTADQDAKIKGTRDSLKKKIKNIVNNSKYQKKDTKNLSEVNKLIYKEYKKALTTTGLKEVAKVLGVPYDKDKNSKLWKSIKDLYGFSKGGIASIIKKNGDDGIATLKRGEAVLTPKQTREFTTLAKNLEFLNHATMLSTNVPKQEFNNSISYGDMNFNFELPNVTDSQTFLNEIKNNQKIQKALQEVTVKQLIDPNKLGVKKIK